MYGHTDGGRYGRTDVRKENLPILQDFVLVEKKQLSSKPEMSGCLLRKQNRGVSEGESTKQVEMQWGIKQYKNNIKRKRRSASTYIISLVSAGR